MWCWRRMEKIGWTDRVRNEEVLPRVKDESKILLTIKRRKAKWIGHILRRNCLLKHVTDWKVEGRTEVTWSWRRRYKQLLDDFKEKRGYCKLKERALDRTLSRTRFGRVYGPVVRQAMKCWSFTNDQRFGLVSIGQTGLEESIWQMPRGGKLCPLHEGM